MGQAETGTKGELIRLGLELGLNLSLEDFPGGVEQNWKYSSAQLGLELGKNVLEKTWIVVNFSAANIGTRSA